MKQAKPNLEQKTIGRILRSTATQSNWQYQDKLYAKQQLRKIYSQQLSKALSAKKYYFLWDKNRTEIDQQANLQSISKLQKLNSLQQKSQQRKIKLINDRVKLYKIHDKQWFYKKQSIKSMKRDKDESLREAARACRLKTETEWQQRQAQTRNFMDQYSQKYHKLYNSNSPTSRSISSHSLSQFNQSKYQQLVFRRKSKLNAQSRLSKDRDQITKKHQQRQKSISHQKERENVSKVVRKLSKMEEIQIKRHSQQKKKFMQLARQKLNAKIYVNSKPQIGQICKKHDLHESKFRMKTLNNESSYSPIKPTASRTSVVPNQMSRDKRNQSLLRYYQKARHDKISRLLKTTVRNVITNQFHKAHASSIKNN